MTPGSNEHGPRTFSRRSFAKGLGVFVSAVSAGGPAVVAEVARRTAERAQAPSTPNAYGPEVSREFLEAHPVNIAASASRTDASGNVIQKFDVVGNTLYTTSLNQATQTFSLYTEVSKIPMEHVTSIVSSNDGKVLLAGGEDPIRTGATKVYISYDAGKTWKNINWPYQSSGSTIDLLKFTENNYLGNNGNYEGGVGQFVVSINPSGGTAQVKAASYESLKATNFNAGSAYDLRIASINPTTSKAEMISSGAFNLQQGIVLYKDFDYSQGTGTVENITHVNINGVDKELGFLRGGAQYTDSNGHTHFKTIDDTLQIMYDIDLVTRTATKQSYAYLLDSKGIANYANGSLRLAGLDINGNNTWVAGAYGLTSDGYYHAVLINLETGEYYNNLAPNTRSSIDQKGIKRVKINGQAGYELVVSGLGKAFVPTNPDGSPIPGVKPVYTSKGLGNLKDFLTNRVFAPIVARSLDGN